MCRLHHISCHRQANQERQRATTVQGSPFGSRSAAAAMQAALNQLSLCGLALLHLNAALGYEWGVQVSHRTPCLTQAVPFAAEHRDSTSAAPRSMLSPPPLLWRASNPHKASICTARALPTSLPVSVRAGGSAGGHGRAPARRVGPHGAALGRVARARGCHGAFALQEGPPELGRAALPDHTAGVDCRWLPVC